jgi:hypothetical protein
MKSLEPMVRRERQMYWEEKRKNETLLESLQYLDSAIMPNERKYDEYGYCKIHRDILTEWAITVKQALVKA